MSTIQPILKPAPVRWTATVLTTATAIIALTVTVLFIALPGGSRGTHPAVLHPASTYYPLIQYRGTGAPPMTAADTRPATPTSVSPHRSYGAVP